MSDHYANISRDQNKERKTGKHRKRKKEEELSDNEPFTERELKSAMNQQKNTTPGEDSIHPQMIKRLPQETLKHLLDVYNKIWEEGEIPKTGNTLQ